MTMAAAVGSKHGVPPIMARIFPLCSKYVENPIPKLHNAKEKISSLVIVGDRQSRSNLLFQAAISYTIEGATVSYLSPRAFSKMPLCVHGLNQPSAAHAHQLKMVYMASLDEVLQYLSQLNLQPSPPDFLILDDLSCYITQDLEEEECRTLAKLSSLLVDAACYLKGKSSSRSHTGLLVGMASMADQHSTILSLFFPDIYTIQVSGNVRHVMSPMDRSKSTNKGKTDTSALYPQFHYYLKDSQIFLEEVLYSMPQSKS